MGLKREAFEIGARLGDGIRSGASILEKAGASWAQKMKAREEEAAREEAEMEVQREADLARPAAPQASSAGSRNAIDEEISDTVSRIIEESRGVERRQKTLILQELQEVEARLLDRISAAQDLGERQVHF